MRINQKRGRENGRGREREFKLLVAEDFGHLFIFFWKYNHLTLSCIALKLMDAIIGHYALKILCIYLFSKLTLIFFCTGRT